MAAADCKVEIRTVAHLNLRPRKKQNDASLKPKHHYDGEWNAKREAELTSWTHEKPNYNIAGWTCNTWAPIICSRCFS
jgi:hypothetical protein